MKIDEIIIKLCELDSRDEMEVYLEKEIEKTENLLVNRELDEYRSCLHDINGYMYRGKFRNKKPIYQKLLDRVNDLQKGGG